MPPHRRVAATAKLQLAAGEASPGVVVTVCDDRSFDLELRTPPTSALLARAAGLPRGGARPGTARSMGIEVVDPG